jgi:hypothetical protein
VSNARFLARLGLFVAEGFFSQSLCEQFMVEARSATTRPAEIVRQGADLLDTTVRSTEDLHLSRPTISLVRERLQSLRLSLESHFHLKLSGCEAP